MYKQSVRNVGLTKLLQKDGTYKTVEVVDLAKAGRDKIPIDYHVIYLDQPERTNH